MVHEILGAGPAGLCCAINLAKAGEKARVHEIKPDVGMRFHANLQGLKHIGDPEKFMKSLNITSKVKIKRFPRAYICTRTRDIGFDMRKTFQMSFVERGGKGSLEYCLYKEAEKQGVKFEFSSKRREKDANIVATGCKRADASAFGAVFEDTDFPRDCFLILFDDRYSPKGLYSYILPISSDKVEFVTCVTKPYIPQLTKCFEKALKERKIIRHFLEGKKRVASFGGSGGTWVPKTAYIGGRYYVGEAAGFQDPYMGFGITHALASGKLAADAIKKNLDYDTLWKKELMPNIRKDFAWRFPLSVFGDWLVDKWMKNYPEKYSGDITKVVPENTWWYGPTEALCFNLELLRHRITGNW